ncbi:MAG: MauE/DoxX family redox-associated membrane protein [Actinomycetota bacterium]
MNGLALAAVALGAALAGATARGTWSVAAPALAVVFGWAAMAKVLHPRGWREAIEAHGIRGPAARLARGGVPLVEGAVPALVVAGWSAGAAALALGLLAVFSVVLGRTWRRGGGAVPCGCFGRRHVRDVRVLLARNAGLAVVAILALAGGPDRGLAPALPMGGAVEVLPAVLVVVGIVVGAALVRRAVALRAP